MVEGKELADACTPCDRLCVASHNSIIKTEFALRCPHRKSKTPLHNPHFLTRNSCFFQVAIQIRSPLCSLGCASISGTVSLLVNIHSNLHLCSLTSELFFTNDHSTFSAKHEVYQMFERSLTRMLTCNLPLLQLARKVNIRDFGSTNRTQKHAQPRVHGAAASTHVMLCRLTMHEQKRAKSALHCAGQGKMEIIVSASRHKHLHCHTSAG